MFSQCKKKNGEIEKFDVNKLSKSISLTFKDCGTIHTSYLTDILATAIRDKIYEDLAEGNDSYIPSTDEIAEYTSIALDNCSWDYEARVYLDKRPFKA